MRRIGCPVLLALIPVILIGHAFGGYMPAAPAPSPAGALGSSETATYLFVQGAQSAVVKLKNVTDLSAGGLLTLQGVDENTVWFTNFPVRKAGRIRSQKLAETGDFWRNVPNAALVGHLPGDNDSSTVVLMLMDPVVNSTTREITYDVDLITPEGDRYKVNHTSDTSYILLDEDSGLTLVRWNQSSTIELTDVTLFIDNTCWNGIIFKACWDDNGNNAWKVGVGPFGFSGSNCPSCYPGGAPNRPGCWDQWGKWHYQGDPWGYCDWGRNLWIYTP